MPLAPEMAYPMMPGQMQLAQGMAYPMMPGSYAPTQGFSISAYGQQVDGSAVQVTQY